MLYISFRGILTNNADRACVEKDADFKYASGNDEPGRGFGHICVTVDDLQAACARFDEMGVKFKKRPEEGRMRVSVTSNLYGKI
jgi:catechol 2,3-dioxygenase-like lactoylglutathione lyase family enzyme